MKLLPLFVFWGLWYLNFSARAIFSPILPLIEDTLSISHGEAGGLFTSLAIGYSLTLLISGRFAVIWGYKRTVVSGFIGIGFVFLGFQWIDSYLAFQILFFFLGIATGSYLTSILPIITETYESRHWGKVLGIHDSAASFCILSVPILVALGLHFLSWRTLLLLLGAVSLLLPV
jgi:NNP family nitrate/nitrite transporter-like MFS transporter